MPLTPLVLLLSKMSKSQMKGWQWDHATLLDHISHPNEHMLVIHPKCKWVLAMTTEKRETYTPLKAWCWHELSFQVQVCQSSDNHLSAQAHLLNAEFQHKELPSINRNIVFILEGISKNKRGLSLLRWFARTLGDLCFEGGPLWEACYQGNTSRSSVCIHT